MVGAVPAIDMLVECAAGAYLPSLVGVAAATAGAARKVIRFDAGCCMFDLNQYSEDNSINVIVVDENGQEVTGLAYDSTDASCYYLDGSSATEIPLVELALPSSAHADGGFIEIDADNLPGLYRLDLPDALVATTEKATKVMLSFSSTARMVYEVKLESESDKIEGAVTSGATATSIPSGLSGYSSDAFNGAWLHFVSGALKGQVRQISDFSSTGSTFTVSAFTAAPSSGDRFVIINR
jgi:hypothetical protein